MAMHPTEHLSRLLRLQPLTGTVVDIPGRPANTLEVLREKGWLGSLMGMGSPPTKEEVVQFVSERIFVAERFLQPARDPAQPRSWKLAVRDHARAAVYTLGTVMATMPFTTVFVAAATHTGRYTGVLPRGGNLHTMRLLARMGGFFSLWQGAVPLALSEMLDESTYRLRLKALPAAAVYVLVYLCEVVAVRKICWDPRYKLAGLANGWFSIGPLTNFLTGYVLTLLVNFTGIGYYLPLSSLRYWLMAHPFDTLADATRLGSRWATFKGFFRGIRVSLWAAIPRLLLEYAVLLMLRQLMNTVLGITRRRQGLMEWVQTTVMGGGGTGLGGGIDGTAGPGDEAAMIAAMQQMMGVGAADGTSGGTDEQAAMIVAMQQMMGGMMGGASVGGGSASGDASDGAASGMDFTAMLGGIGGADDNTETGSRVGKPGLDFTAMLGGSGEVDGGGGMAAPAGPVVAKITKPTSDANWQTVLFLLEGEDDLMLVLYYSVAVPECTAALTEFEELARSLSKRRFSTGSVTYAAVDCDTLPEAAAAASIGGSYPTYRVFHGSDLIGQVATTIEAAQHELTTAIDDLERFT